MIKNFGFCRKNELGLDLLRVLLIELPKLFGSDFEKEMIDACTSLYGKCRRY